MSLTKEEILANSPSVQQVSTPEWGADGHVFVRSCPANAVALIQKASPGQTADLPAAIKALARLCVLFVCDEQGIPLFTDSDVESLLAQPVAPLRRCAEAGLALNGFDELDDDLEGNSASVSTAGLPST